MLRKERKHTMLSVLECKKANDFLKFLFWKIIDSQEAIEIVERSTTYPSFISPNGYILQNWSIILKPEKLTLVQCVWVVYKTLQYVDSCNDHHNQDTELCYHHKDLFPLIASSCHHT